jgi:enhancing lycopene biosynthesis protein 2
MSTKKVCVVISGCGFLDGAEVHESVLTLLALSSAGAEYTIVAPHKAQMHVVNHHTQEAEAGASRMVHVEAARIARGPVADITTINHEDFDAVFLPGGFGAAKNLSDFAVNGAAGSVDPGVKNLLSQFHTAGKPIGAVCIAPAVLAMSLGKGTVTIGSDAGTASQIESLGGNHKNCAIDDVVVDTEHKIATAPAYMLDGKIHEVAAGIEKTVQAVLNMC